MMERKEFYFVCSESECPRKIYFNEIEAFVSGFEYIDSFDKEGNLLYSYKLVDGEYTNDF